MKSTFDKPVAFVQDDTLVSSLCDWFHMIDDHFASESILKTDEVLSVHFNALLHRLTELSHWSDPNCHQICVVGFGGDPED